MKTFFFGATFCFLLVFAAVLSLRLFFVDEPPRWPWARLGVGLALAFALAYVLLKHPYPAYSGGHRDAPGIAPVEQTCRDVLNALRAGRDDGPVQVFVTVQARELNCHTLRWRARQAGDPFRFRDPSLNWTDLEPYRREMGTAHYILAYRTSHPEMRYPSERLAADSLALARSLPDLVEIGEFPSSDGTVYYLFRNHRLVGPGQSVTPAARTF
jgi:hypothetical protein